MIFDIPILLCLNIQMSFYDWRAIVVRWLLMPFSQDFLVIPVKKSDTSIKYKRQINLTHHKQGSESLENFVSMAIQGTQVLMYTKHTLFLYFSDFSIYLFIYLFFIWKTKQSKTEKWPNKNIKPHESRKKDACA